MKTTLSVIAAIVGGLLLAAIVTIPMLVDLELKLSAIKYLGTH